MHGAAHFATTLCRGQLALESPLVHVEANLGSGLPTFIIVGLPEAAVRESKERVRAAIENCGFEFPPGRITVNLAPADLPKEGGRFDLAIALGILLASGQVVSRSDPGSTTPRELYGELGLAGELKPVRGLLPAAAHAARAGHQILVPAANLGDVLVVAERGTVSGAEHLLQACACLRGERGHPGQPRGALPHSLPALPTSFLDLRDVRGQHHAKRALVIAAAGAHSLLMHGPPGSGKSMLAQRLPALLPPLTRSEALEVAMIASLATAGFDPRAYGRRPFRAPHHTASAPAIVGGGARGLPGEASLAHHGILFLDELPEFDRCALEALREPLETGVISIARARLRAQYPAAFQLVAAMNPCPCGYLGDLATGCRCTPRQIAGYRGRVSGPLLDRIDLHVQVARVPASELSREHDAVDDYCAEAQSQVARARSRQLSRAGKLNRDLTPSELRRRAALGRAASRLVEQAFERLKLTARSYERVLRVARTIADLEESDAIEPQHVAEAVQFRRSA
ncbi:MAG TPA: YifB family Mg chelatase-like AAA ATPase [Steroidobacteraceae bacterium]|nr:YifB family Mg chelatase-like AAA ATPase [Steroidobacteraceae bacterium]